MSAKTCWSAVWFVAIAAVAQGCESPEATSRPSGTAPGASRPADTAVVFVHSGEAVYHYDLRTHEKRKLFGFTLNGRPFDMIYDIAVAPDGRMIAVSSTWIYSVDSATGALTAIRRADDLGTVNGAAFTSDGRLLIAGTGIQSVDLATRKVTRLVEDQTYVSSGDLVQVPDGSIFWTVNETHNDVGDTLVRVDLSTGRITRVATLSEKGVYGLVYSDGKLAGFARNGDAFTLDPRSGQISELVHGDIGWFGAGSGPSQAPAPVAPQPCNGPACGGGGAIGL